MWYRAELNKDGSIATLEQCDEAFKNGRHVVYVEADSKAEASTKVLEWYKRYCAHRCAYNERRIARRAQAKDNGMCTGYGGACGRKAQNGKLCRVCRRESNDRGRRYRAGESRPRIEKTPAELMQAKCSRSAKQRERTTAAHRMIGVGNMQRIRDRLTSLSSALEAFDRKDRRWFVDEIAKCNKVIREYKKALAAT